MLLNLCYTIRLHSTTRTHHFLSCSFRKYRLKKYILIQYLRNHLRYRTNKFHFQY